MAKQKRITGRYKFKHPRVKNDLHEFPSGQKGLVFCNDCGSVYYKKSWHHSLLNIKSVKKDISVKFSRCPACTMIKNHQFEGEITISNIPLKLRTELTTFIERYCQRAYSRDPMDRLIEIKKSKNSLVVRLTENQLANKLGKKIKNFSSNTKLKTKFIGSPSDVGRVRIDFLK